MAEGSGYAAFISYSHSDESLAAWLHHKLESYQSPGALVGRPGKAGPIGKRLGKVFRDRAELGAHPDLGAEIRAALDRSEAMIVLCSPNASASQYVNEEIRYFKALGRGDRIVAAIVNGEPHAAGKKIGDAILTDADECFPHAMRFQIAADGSISAAPETLEPIAADFRTGKDGREGAKLKVIAGLIGVGLDELVQRELAAQRARMLRAAGIAAAVVILAVAAGVFAFQSFRNLQRANREASARMMAAVRTHLLADQPGPALALMDALRGRSLAAADRATLDLLDVFWRERLAPARDAPIANRPGRAFRIADQLYYRTASRVMPFPIDGAQQVFWTPGGSRLFAVAQYRRLYELDPETGRAREVFPDAPEQFAITDVFLMPSGALLAIGTNYVPGGDEGLYAGAQNPIGFVVYPDGQTSGVIEAHYASYFRANAECTKLYFVHSPYTELRLEYSQPLPTASGFSYVVTTLAPAANWREPAGEPIAVNMYDWMDSRGATVDVACSAHRLRSASVDSDELALRIPAYAGDGWETESTPSAERALTQSWRAFARSQVWGGEGVSRWTDHFTGGGRDVGLFSVFSARYLDYLVCSRTGGQTPECTDASIPGGGGARGFLPRFGLFVANEPLQVVNVDTLQLETWPNNIGSPAAGRTLAENADGTRMASIDAAGQITIIGRAQGRLAAIHQFSDPQFASPAALALIDDTDVLVLTQDDRLHRIDVAGRRIVWQTLDRSLRTRADEGDLAPIELKVSPNGRIALIVTENVVRLYETRMGAPLTPAYPPSRAGLETWPTTRADVTDNGEIAIRDDRTREFLEGGYAFVRPAPQPQRPSGASSVCLLGAEVSDGNARLVDVFSDPAMVERCGLQAIAPRPG